MVLPATISAGIFSTATEPMPGVSFGPSALTSAIFPSLSITVTVIAPGPPKPSAVPVPITDEPRFCWVMTIMTIITMADTSANTFFFMVVFILLKKFCYGYDKYITYSDIVPLLFDES